MHNSSESKVRNQLRNRLIQISAEERLNKIKKTIKWQCEHSKKDWTGIAKEFLEFYSEIKCLADTMNLHIETRKQLETVQTKEVILAANNFPSRGKSILKQLTSVQIIPSDVVIVPSSDVAATDSNVNLIEACNEKLDADDVAKLRDLRRLKIKLNAMGVNLMNEKLEFKAIKTVCLELLEMMSRELHKQICNEEEEEDDGESDRSDYEEGDDSVNVNNTVFYNK